MQQAARLRKLLGMMLSSGNDAANALASAAGGVPTTVSLMQQEATSLGALDTTVRDPSGLDSPGQRSSAYLLSKVAVLTGRIRS